MSSMYGNSALYGNQGMKGPTGQGQQGLKGPTGKVSGYNKIPNFTPEMMQLFQQMFGEVGPETFTGRLARGDEGAFEEMEAPALRQFAGLQGNIASRFSGMGIGGRRSSGFQNTMSQAGSDFAQDLQSKRMGLQRQAVQDLWGMKRDLLGQQPFSYEQKPKGFLESILGSGAQGFGEGGASALMKLLPFLLG